MKRCLPCLDWMPAEMLENWNSVRANVGGKYGDHAPLAPIQQKEVGMLSLSYPDSSLVQKILSRKLSHRSL